MSDKFKEILIEAEVNQKKVLPELHALDDSIEEFIQKLEKRINSVQDNPIFVRRAHQLIADMNKEYSEFIAALRAIVNAVDRAGMRLPAQLHQSKARDINIGAEAEAEAAQEEK